MHKRASKIGDNCTTHFQCMIRLFELHACRLICWATAKPASKQILVPSHRTSDTLQTRKFTSFGQPTRLITCANHGNGVICACSLDSLLRETESGSVMLCKLNRDTPFKRIVLRYGLIRCSAYANPSTSRSRMLTRRKPASIAGIVAPARFQLCHGHGMQRLTMYTAGT